MDRRRIGEILRQETGLSEEIIEEGLKLKVEKGQRLGEFLIKQKHITEEDLARVLSIQSGYPYLAEIPVEGIDLGLVGKIPINFAKRYLIVPLAKNDGTVQIAVSDPFDFYPLDDLARILDARLELRVASGKRILDLINQIYEREQDRADQMMGDLADQDLGSIASGLEEPKDLLDETDEAPIIRFVNSLLFQAVKERASDIHIEPFERDLSVRFRIDGVLRDKVRPPKRLQASITSRVKIMAGLNIAEKRLPQDGRIHLKIAGKDIDVRASTVPTSHGERVVLRLLDRSSILLPLEQTGLTGEELKLVNRLIQRSNGIILVVGPTGSGKTTTLYAALSKINSEEKNIITIEDPVEYQLPGIGQIQVNPKINLTFANGLRSILRQDPDVILVGEIRDVETAEIAIHASLTGHLVFSTLHTNDAAGAITRLVDMGIEPFLVASSLVSVLAQRLVRTLCPNCRIAYELSPAELAELARYTDKNKTGKLYRGSGCETCSGTGFFGRTGIYEMLLIDDDIRNLITTSTDSNTIKKKASSKGMTSLRDDGFQKVIKGITTMPEVLRVTQEEVVFED
ncbi:MAG: type II secretion system ATPase GspE [Proteobacteria bacterium]|nr:type II secretion system ATPase GspE [Pseudomonadota bacterium]